MKTYVLAGTVVGLASVLGLAQESAPKIVSPEVGPDGRVTFRVLAPNAHDVALTGEFMQGSRNLSKNEDGVWSVTVGPLEPEIYNYNVTVFHESGGAHTWMVWRRYLNEISPLLFR